MAKFVKNNTAEDRKNSEDRLYREPGFTCFEKIGQKDIEKERPECPVNFDRDTENPAKAQVPVFHLNIVPVVLGFSESEPISPSVF